MKWAQKALCVALADSPILKNTFQQQICGIHQCKPLSFLEKMIRHDLVVANKATCLNSLAPRRWQFKMFEVFHLHHVEEIFDICLVLALQCRSWSLTRRSIHTYCHPQIDYFVISRLFSVARHARFSKLRSKPGWLIRQPKILPPSHDETSVRVGILNAYVSHLFCLHISS